MKRRTGRHILIEALLAQGVKTVYGGAEESIAEFCAEIRESSLRLVTCAQDADAGFMAEAAGRLTGRTGVCLVAQGAGVAGAVQAAMESSSPVLMLIEQAGAAGEIDYRLVFGAPLAKWVLQARRAQDIPRLLRQAFEASITGRAGPVVVALAGDALREESEYAALPPLAPVRFGPRHNDLERLAQSLAAAKKPLAIAGGSGWTAEAIEGFADFCARASVPVVTGFGRQDVFPNTHDCYAGSLGPASDPRLLAAVEEADLIIAAGTRLGDRTTQGYKLLASPQPKQPLVHIYPDSTELNRVYKASLAIHSDIPAFVRALELLPLHGTEIQGWAQGLRAQYLAWSALNGGLRATVIDSLPPGAILVTEGGVGDGWPQRFMRVQRPQRLVTALTENAGYGLQAALAAGELFPDRGILCFIDAASFVKAASGLEAARRKDQTIIILVTNEAEPKADVAALARVHGVEVLTVGQAEALPGLLKKALSAAASAVIDIRVAF